MFEHLLHFQLILFVIRAFSCLYISEKETESIKEGSIFNALIYLFVKENIQKTRKISDKYFSDFETIPYCNVML